MRECKQGAAAAEEEEEESLKTIVSYASGVLDFGENRGNI
jgi:hypothetical protein